MLDLRLWQEHLYSYNATPIAYIYTAVLTSGCAPLKITCVNCLGLASQTRPSGHCSAFQNCRVSLCTLAQDSKILAPRPGTCRQPTYFFGSLGINNKSPHTRACLESACKNCLRHPRGPNQTSCMMLDCSMFLSSHLRTSTLERQWNYSLALAHSARE